MRLADICINSLKYTTIFCVYLSSISYSYARSCESYLSQLSHFETVMMSTTLNNWNDIALVFNRNLITNKKNFNKIAKNHRLSPDQMNHFISELGFLASQNHPNLYSTSIEKFQAGYTRILNSSIQDWNSKHPQDQIAKDDLIFEFVFPFYNHKTKHWIALKYKDEIPVGYSYYMNEIPPGKILYPSLAEGKFPILINDLVSHDVFGHAFGWLINLEYSRAYINLARQILLRGGWSSFLSKNNVLKLRVFYFNENFFLIKKDVLLETLNNSNLNTKAIDLLSEAILSGDPYHKGFRPESYLEHLRTMSLDELAIFKTNLLKSFPSLIIKLGGLVADGTNDESLKWNALNYMLEQLEFAVYFGKDIHTIRVKIAIGLVLLALKATYNSQDWAEDLMDLSSDRSGLFDKYFNLLDDLYVRDYRNEGPNYFKPYK